MLNYVLPPEKIAQRPVSAAGERHDSRLLHALAGPHGALRITDRVFCELPALLAEGDLLLLNDSKVLHCRFFARNERTEREIELLLLRKTGGSETRPVFEALAKPLRRIKDGDMLVLSKRLRAKARTCEGTVELELLAAEDTAIAQIIEEDGLAPIPPYIRRGRSDELDKKLYQTVFAETPGSVAAPTAGLHFTPDVLAGLRARGVNVSFVTLHVGPASFLPVRTPDLAAHKMPSESFIIPAETHEAIKKTKKAGGRIVAVGTTVVRALEGAFLQYPFGEPARALEGETSLLISPRFCFNIVDVLITNFHQPESTHLLLVAAFIGMENAEAIYEHALNGGYRFLSYGDSMLLEPPQSLRCSR